MNSSIDHIRDYYKEYFIKSWSNVGPQSILHILRKELDFLRVKLSIGKRLNVFSR